MPSVSFINPAVNYGAEGQDFQAEAQALQRKRAVSDALLKHSMETGINVPVAHSANELSSVISPFAAIGKVGETYLANRAVNNQEGKEVDLAQRYKAAENAAVQDFLAGDANDEKHLMKGMASQFAPVKSAAMEVYKEKMKGKLTPKDLLTAPNRSGESRVAAGMGG